MRAAVRTACGAREFLTAAAPGPARHSAPLPLRCLAGAAMGLGENIKYAVKRYPTVFLQKTKARGVASRRCAQHAPRTAQP